MEIVQFFETTVTDQEARLSVQFVVIPARFVKERGLLKSNEEAIRQVAENLGLKLSEEVPVVRTSSLPFALAAILAGNNDFKQTEGMLNTWLRADLSVEVLQKKIIPPEILLFAEYLASTKLIPTEESPLDLNSLAGMLTGSSGISIGALAGFVAAAGNTPLVLVTVPLGMIIGGIAAGVALALQEGLHDKIQELMGSQKQAGAS